MGVILLQTSTSPKSSLPTTFPVPSKSSVILSLADPPAAVTHAQSYSLLCLCSLPWAAAEVYSLPALESFF